MPFQNENLKSYMMVSGKFIQSLQREKSPLTVEMSLSIIEIGNQAVSYMFPQSFKELIMLQHRFFQKTLVGSIAPLLLSGMLIMQVTPASASDHGHHKAHAKFNQVGELARPANFREWIFIGAPVTPKDMNNGKPAFPEFHYVYIDPASWAHWKKTGEFRDGTIIAKELVGVGSKSAASGSGYFPGDYVGPVAVSVKDSKRFAKSNNWGYFVFGDDKAQSAAADESCVACHKANAAQDMVFTQYWAVLRAASPKK